MTAPMLTQRTPASRGVTLPCEKHGGPPAPMVPYTTFRACPDGPALIVGGRVVAHLGPGETARHRADLDAAEAAS